MPDGLVRQEVETRIMPENPDVSVIIPVFGNQRTLAETLTALVFQTDHYFSTILVDQGNSIDFDYVHSRYGGSLDLIYVNTAPDTGVSTKRNFGASVASGQLLILLDADTLASSHLVSEHRHAWHAGSEAAVGYIYAKDGFNVRHYSSFEDEPDYFQVMDRVRLTGNEMLDSRDAVLRAAGDDLNKLNAPWHVFWSGNASVSRTAWDSVGGFDSRFFGWGFEDVEFGYRLAQAGTKVVFLRNAWAVHYPHEIDMENRSSHATRNMRRLVELHPELDCELYCVYLERWKDKWHALRELPFALRCFLAQDWPVVQEFVTKLECSNILLYGYDECLASFDQITTIIDPRAGFSHLTREVSKRSLQLSGLFVPFQEGEFDCVVMTPLWSLIDQRALGTLAHELARCSRKIAVFLGHNRADVLKGKLLSLLELFKRLGYEVTGFTKTGVDVYICS